jgi:hypothetical protein
MQAAPLSCASAAVVDTFMVSTEISPELCESSRLMGLRRIGRLNSGHVALGGEVDTGAQCGRLWSGPGLGSESPVRAMWRCRGMGDIRGDSSVSWSRLFEYLSKSLMGAYPGTCQ